MLSAKVGDDVYAEDPSINDLQEFVAELLARKPVFSYPPVQ